MTLSLFLKYYHTDIIAQFLRHLEIVAVSLPISILVSVPLGLFISSRPRLAQVVTSIAGVLMTIPSMALFALMVVLLAPFGLGLGLTPAVIAITIYSLLPILRNTNTALNQIDASMIDAARGIGISDAQVMWKVKIPLSLPVIMAGVRNAIVLGVSVAAFASLVAAGGLGFFIFSGIARSNLMMVLVGAVLISLLGITANYLLMKIEWIVTPRGLKVRR